MALRYMTSFKGYTSMRSNYIISFCINNRIKKTNNVDCNYVPQEIKNKFNYSRNDVLLFTIHLVLKLPIYTIFIEF